MVASLKLTQILRTQPVLLCVSVYGIAIEAGQVEFHSKSLYISLSTTSYLSTKVLPQHDIGYVMCKYQLAVDY